MNTPKHKVEIFQGKDADGLSRFLDEQHELGWSFLGTLPDPLLEQQYTTVVFRRLEDRGET